MSPQADISHELYAAHPTHYRALVAVRNLRERVTELEAALREIANETHGREKIPNVYEFAHAALAGDGVDREELSSERTRQGLTDSAADETPYQVTFAVPMSDAAHALLDQVVALPYRDRIAITLALRVIDHVGGMGKLSDPKVES